MLMPNVNQAQKNPSPLNIHIKVGVFRCGFYNGVNPHFGETKIVYEQLIEVYRG